MTDLEHRKEHFRRSVTSEEIVPVNQSGGYFQILLPAVTPDQGALPAYLPLDYRARDMVLHSTVRADAMWAAAIGIAITKAAALAWEVKSDISLRTERAQELLLNADATSISGIGGWVSYMGKQIRNFTCTNAGCFTEIIRATGAYGSRIVGLGHLSALRMRRTGDPEFPFIYIDRWGRQHIMRWWQVFNLVDMPEPDEISLGTGICAAERAYQQIRKLSALEMYLYEKISGTRPLALHIVNGLTQQQLQDMMQGASNAQGAKGLSLYMGAIVATTLKPDSPPSLVTIPLAELPDGFDAPSERERADLIYANALGLDPQDLRPVSNQQMGAGAQSIVLNQKAEGRGQAAYRQQLTHMLNQLVLDDKTKFIFTEHDYKDQKEAADVSAARANVVSTLVDKQIISGPQAVQILVDMSELPPSFIEPGASAGSQLSDTDKPGVEDSLNDVSTPPGPLQMPVMQQQAATPPVNPSQPPTAAAPDNAGSAAPTGAGPIEDASATQAAPAPTKLIKRKSVQVAARKLLREVRRARRIEGITEKGWVTIHGHPVLIGGPGGGGKGTGGKSVSGLSMASVIEGSAESHHAQGVEKNIKSGIATQGDLNDVVAKIDSKMDELKNQNSQLKGIMDNPSVSKGLKDYYATVMPQTDKKIAALRELKTHMYDVASETVGGASKLPVKAPGAKSKHQTLDDYKQGKVDHATTLVKLKEDIKTAKANGDTATVNTLSTQYYKIKKEGPPTGAAAQPVIPPSKYSNPVTTNYASPKPSSSLMMDDLNAIKNQVNTAGGKPGTSKHATLNDYKQGKINHADVQTQLKVDIATAKANGDKATVSTLSTQLYAIKKAGPKPGDDQILSKGIGEGGTHLDPTKAVPAMAGLNVGSSSAITNDQHTDFQNAVNAYQKGQSNGNYMSYYKIQDDMVKKYGITASALIIHTSNAVVGNTKTSDAATALFTGTKPAAPAVPKPVSASSIPHTYGVLGNGTTPKSSLSDKDQTMLSMAELHTEGKTTTPEYLALADKAKNTYGVSGSAIVGHVNEAKKNAGLSITSQAAATATSSFGGYKPPTPVKDIVTYNGQEYAKLNGHAAYDFARTPEAKAEIAKLNATEHAKIVNYTGNGYSSVNNALREMPGHELTPELKAKADTIQKGLLKTHIPENVVITRGFSNYALEAAMKGGQSITGATFHDKGFVSTSVNSEGGFTESIKIRIHMAKGQPGLAVDSISLHPGEHEVLLPHSSNFRIDGYKSNGYGWDVEATYLGVGDMLVGAFKAED